MAFKFITLFALLAAANAGYVSPVTYAGASALKYINPAVDAVASTQQNVVRSFDGTLSSYSKAVDTSYSSVRKADTRINNNVYAPAVGKTVTYAAPAVVKSVAAPTVYAHVAPTIAKTVTYDVPSLTKSILAPTVYSHAGPAFTRTVYSHQKPLVYSQPAVAKTLSYSTPAVTTSYNHGPDATTYSHSAPGVSGYGTSQTVQYSPAELVSHMSFDGFGTHWGF